MPEQYAQSPVSVKQLKREKLKNIIKGAKTATGEKAAIVMINPEIDTNVHGIFLSGAFLATNSKFWFW